MIGWTDWWIWAAAALVLAILEVLVPGYVFLGFALGAGAVALIFLAGGPLAGWMAGTLPLTLLGFAVLSLLAWLVLRRLLGVRKGQVKTFDRDINED